MKRILILLLLLSSICLGSNITDNNTSNKFDLVCIDNKLYIEDPKINALVTANHNCSYDGEDLKIYNTEPAYIAIAKTMLVISLSLSASLIVLCGPFMFVYGMIKNRR